MLTTGLDLNPRPGRKLRLGSTLAAAQSLAVAEFAAGQSRPVLLITENTATAYRMEQELKFFDPQLPVHLLPDWETLPYDVFSPHQDIISERLRCLAELPNMQHGILLAPITTLLHRLPPTEYLQGHSLQLKKGQALDLKAMRDTLEKSGYRHVDTVYEHGEYTIRGALLDLFPMGSREPYRIDLLDDEIDTLRSFEPETQRSIEQFDEISLLPGREYPLDDKGIRGFKDRWHGRFDVDHRQCPLYRDICDGIASAGIEYYLPLFFEKCASLFDYLPIDTAVVTVTGIEAAAEHFWRDANQRYEQRSVDTHRPILPPTDIFLAVEEMFGLIKPLPQLVLHVEPLPDSAGNMNLPTAAPPALQIDAHSANPTAALREFASQRRVLLCAESAGRREALIDLLTANRLKPTEVAGWHEFIASKKALCITTAPLEHGAVLVEDGLALVAEPQLFGQHAAQRRRRRKATTAADQAIKNLVELRLGSPVVHIDHGVGRYRGLQSIEVDKQVEEFLALEYADGAKLYVPVSALHMISRYSGADEDLAPLHRLGTDQWQKARRKAAEKVRDVAAELLDIYATREARTGYEYTIERTEYQRFASEFPFEETPDQETAIEAVLNDMRSPRPMDRLVCGDVGFGKTEVAMRAAFISVQNNRQVAILVPTTLLAQQHFESFRDRFADWPMTIDVISRFRSQAEQTAIIEKLNNGQVDILIGTHKLLGGGIKYKNLGLVIIDEEHRFGVRQKETLKALRAEVDILTLTATPIPRTLNMSMSGMRDLSIIATPPARRLSVKTFVRERDPALIKEAILREILRGGQVYYLHNDVKTIEKAARELAEAMPELRVGIGHGQLRERELEQVMSDFYHKRHNVLVCSTIIETGIDVPNANTIIIERADKFGLAQLHQLRGRVGRSHHQAYAYLITPPVKQMTGDAEKRLLAISEADTLGAGFTLATHDLEIRGAGELLGDEQSGQISSIGFSLYMEMLERAVKAIREGRTIDLEQPESTTEINLRLPALIPDDYLPDVQGRLILYKRIASAVDDHELRELQVEMIDRFGLLPEPTKNLFRLAALKLQAQALGIRKLEASFRGGRMEFGETTQIDPANLVTLVQTKPASYRLDGATALRFSEALDDNEVRFQFVENLIRDLSPTA
ncbi:MAG: transcription-repair coupling factor (superfamily II helicase) [Paracoccaceae bacterium]